MDALQKPLGVGVLRIVEDLPVAAGLHDLPAVHNKDPVAETGHHAQIVGDHDHRGIHLFLHIPDQIQHLGLDRHIQGCGGLVGDDELRIVGQGDGNDDPLAHTAGKLMGILIQTFFRGRDPHLAHELNGAGAGFGVRNLLVVFYNLCDLPSDLHHWI